MNFKGIEHFLIGNDVSRHNPNFPIGSGCFNILKATEGKTYVDPTFADRISKIEDGDLVGFYHFARPDLAGNNPKLEAENFVNTVKKFIGKAIFILDWEGKALNYDDDYAINFMLHVEAMTGVKPILYTGSWATIKCPDVARYGYELWIAHYGVSEPKIRNFTNWRMWQFTSTPFDFNIFKGTEEDWKRLASSKYDENIINILRERGAL